MEVEGEMVSEEAGERYQHKVNHKVALVQVEFNLIKKVWIGTVLHVEI